MQKNREDIITPEKTEKPKTIELTGFKRKAPITLIDKYEQKISKILQTSEDSLTKKRSCSVHFCLGDLQKY